ncbi:hypothetical protein M0804_008482 [Polistes exclamans]|nr:hypothetical protein M0804_008482 [Polistes exclamans]
MEKQAEVLEQSQFIDMKQRFDDELSKIRVNATKKRFFLTETTYQKLINDVQEAKTTDKKKPKDYKLLKRYDVKIVENKIKLIYPVEEEGVDTIQYYITDSELFNILHETHLAIRHGRQEELKKVIESIHLIGEEDEINHNLQEEEHDKDMLNEEISIFDICCVCLNETNDVLPACDKCDRKMHTFCGFASIHNENDILCNLCFKIENAIEHKIQCKIQLEMQSNNNKRKINSKNQFPIITLGTNVRIPIPNVNKVRNNSNILAVVINMTEDGFYQLGTSEGILKKLYTRSKFTLCRKNQLKIEDIPYREISIRDFSVAFAQSSGSGLGFIKCKCKKKCRSLKCLCLKNLMKCNLTCHSSLPCCNK